MIRVHGRHFFEILVGRSNGRVLVFGDVISKVDVLCYVSSFFYANRPWETCWVASSGKRVLESDCGRVSLDRLAALGTSVVHCVLLTKTRVSSLVQVNAIKTVVSHEQRN